MDSVATTRIKGAMLLSRLKFVAHLPGQDNLAKLIAELAPVDQEVLRGTILASGWYPLDLYLRLDGAIAKRFSPDDPRKIFLALGGASAEENLKGVHRAFIRPNDPHFLLSRAQAIYRLYYSVGERTYERTSATSGILRTTGAELVTATDCLTVVGWYIRAIELCGGKTVAVTEKRCQARGDNCCEYHCTWHS